ncbi:MAG TPA: MarR family transcriptional regulator [Chitinophagaceae bacterium]|jgi:DNA-binding MarR family transcriptional regulator|nr:MarR family transcriptional regulator [Chitinophagaceae bacterium]
MYFASSALARKVEKLATTAWQPVNMSPSHGYLLLMVLDEPGIQPGALVAELLLSPSTVTRLLDKLEGKKLVSRISSGKQINVYPTQKARSMQRQLKGCQAEFYETYGRLFGKEETKKLVQTLNRLTDKL